MFSRFEPAIVTATVCPCSPTAGVNVEMLGNAVTVT
jgi:hypothetical protein